MEIIKTQAQAYIGGWRACENGCDGRYLPETQSGGPLAEDLRYAFTHGFLDAMDREDDNEEPEPACHGYGARGYFPVNPGLTVP
jgi:hypothetical protein